MLDSRAILVGERPNEVTVGTVELPDLSPQDVLVESRVVGICRSDIELREGHLDHIIPVTYPVVPGHEWCGVVVRTGSSVRGLAPGDRVVGECLITSHDWFGCNVNGAGSDRFVVPAQVLHKVPDSIDDTMAAIVEPFTIAFRAVREAGRCDAGDVVAVIGGGMIGQCAASICRANGAVVVVVEPNADRRRLALELGADHAVDPAELDTGDWFEVNFGVAGPQLVVEASGAAPGLALGMRIADFEGRIVMIGITATTSIPAPLNMIQAKNLRILGVTGSPKVWPAALRFIDRAGIDLSRLVSARFSFDEAVEAFAAAEDPANLKIHLSPEGVA